VSDSAHTNRHEILLRVLSLFVSEREGFGVPFADILSARYTPAYAFLGASVRRHFSNKAIALKFLQERSGSNPSVANVEFYGVKLLS
jgi:hypothetical protein